MEVVADDWKDRRGFVCCGNMLVKRALTILELNWYERFGDKKKENINLSSWKEQGRQRNVKKMKNARAKMGKPTCKAKIENTCKAKMKNARARRANDLIVKYANL